MNLRTLFTAAALLCTLPALAQAGRPGSTSFAFNIGWNAPQGDFDKTTEDGYTGSFDFTYNLNPKLAFRTEIGRASNNMDASAFLNLSDFSGTVYNYNLTENLIFTLNPDAKVNIYLIGGLGGARVTQEIGAYYYYGTGWWPGWGYYPVTGYNAAYSESTTKLTYNAGVGVQIKFSRSFSMSLESRYTWIETQNSIEYIPLALGFRWM